jgi:hypothetical protein
LLRSATWFAATMLTLAFATLFIAALIGSGLALLFLRGPAARPPHRAIPAVHGAVGTASLALLLTALRRDALRPVMGTAGFGRTAAALLVLALAFGLVILAAAWRRRRPNVALVGAHAGFAIAGLVVLSALIALG